MKIFKKFLEPPFILSAAFLAFSIFGFMFLYGDMIKNRNEAEANDANWRAEAERRSGLQLENRTLRQLEAERAMLDGHFVKGGDVVPFLAMAEELAPKAGAKMEVSLVDILKDGAGLMVELRAGGKFDNIYKFLELLEASPYELEFVAIDMGRADIADAKGQPIEGAWLGVFKIRVLSFVP